MSEKRSAGSILEFFTKKVKGQTLSVIAQNATEEIPLTDFTHSLASSHNKNIEISSTIEVSTHAGRSNLSNVNNILEYNDESPRQLILLDSFDKPSNTNSLTSSSQTTNSVSSNSINQRVSLVSKCVLYSCNSSTPYHPNRSDELTLSTLDKRSYQKRWLEDYSWLTYVIGKQMFKEFDKLIRIYLTIPVTTATAERTFSTLNRLKNALRTTMGQSRPNHCLIAHIYKEKLDNIVPNKIMATFISSNENRQAFFGLIV